MGKRKGDNQFADDDVAPKKHKKHKKKHKHKRSEYDDHDDSPVPEITSPKTSFKLKLKIGGETVSTKNVTTIEQASVSSFDDAQDDPIINVTDDVSWDSASVALTPQSSTAAETKPKVNTDDEEEKWLTALEAGTLDDMGEIPKARDPLLLTARQRAMLHGHQVELQQLPSGYKTVELTEEQKQRRLQRAKKRRQQAHEKREKDKKQTMDRLLKKQETKTKGSKLKKRSNVPRVRYMSTAHGVSLSFPHGNLFPITPQVAGPPKPVVMCGVKGCNNPKKYACSKTQVPLCSLQCYKKNQALSKNSGTLPVVTT
ncbi:INO80 complex subunit B-like [Littorina saxatilis]|uniref:INO80 complex subunit B-like conserved region domain-containing protein n=1 Tax=Littorina saxatilis TaxID=31220 RepID=A0AAN9FWT4_9CAEN